MRRLSTRLLLLALCAAIGLAGCHHTPDEQRIRNAIGAMQQALEQRNPRDFMAYVADDFVGNDGSFERKQLHNMLRLQVLRNDKIGVALGPIDVTVTGDRATANLTATITGGSGGLLPEHGAIYTFKTSWKRDAGDWKVYHASWQRKL